MTVPHIVAVHCKMKKKIAVWNKKREIQNIAKNSVKITYFTTNVRISLTVCDKLNRPDRRLPSANRIWIEVVGCDESTFNFWLALWKYRIMIIFVCKICFVYLNYSRNTFVSTYNFSFSSFWPAFCGTETTGVDAGLNKIFQVRSRKVDEKFQFKYIYPPRAWPAPENKSLPMCCWIFASKPAISAPCKALIFD